MFVVDINYNWFIQIVCMSQFRKMKIEVGKWINVVNREFIKEEVKWLRNI